jgi:hypothetical protein
MTTTNNITALEQAQAFAEIREQQRQEVLALIKEAHKSIKFKKPYGSNWHVFVEGWDFGKMHTQWGSFGKEWATHGIECNGLEWKPLNSHGNRPRGERTRLQLAKCIVHARLMMEAGFEVGFIYY